MGFFEKVKNMFTEEVEDDDVKVEQIKRETTKVSFEAPKEEDKPVFEDETTQEFTDLEKTEKIEKIEKIEDIDEVYTEEPKENKPIFFDDKDFRDLNFGVRDEKKEEPKKEQQPIYTRSSIYTKETITTDEREPYGRKIERETVVEEKKIFKPTPIISPVYGILDKNYHKEDIVSRNEVKEPVLSPIDTVRNKAYGTLEDELENTLFGTNSILFKKDDKDTKNEVSEIDDSVLSNLTDDISKELDELLIKKEKVDPVDEIEEPKEEKKTSNRHVDDEEDLLNFIDSTRIFRLHWHYHNL